MIEELKSALEKGCNLKVHVTTKQQLENDQQRKAAMEEHGCMAVLSSGEQHSPELLHPGGFVDDGILRVEVKGVGLVYNVHLSGGSFGKPADVVEKKRQARVAELKVLNEDLRASLQSELGIFICGDFNCDSNDKGSQEIAQEIAQDIAHLPEQQCSDLADAWEKGPQEPEGLGCTESRDNAWRRCLKPGQDRHARFDKIVYRQGHCQPFSVKLIGNEQFDHEDAPGVPLFPSDHFGIALECQLGCP